MNARCARCQTVFSTDSFGKQHCPNCGAELILREPAAPEPAPPSTTTPPPGPAAAAATPTAGEPARPVPSDARCAAHPDRPAAGICGRCGAFACSDCLQPGPDGTPQCQACRDRAGADQPTPWEQRDQLGLLNAWYQTVRLSVVDPLGFFARMRVRDGSGALSFYWLNYGVGVILAQLWQVLFGLIGFSLTKPPELPAENPFASLFRLQASSWFNLAAGIGAALMAPLVLYVSAGLFHLGMMLFKGAKSGFPATLRSVGYAAGPQLLQAVPLCGGVIGQLWSLVLIVIGLWKTHRSSPGVAIGAVLVPIVVLGCCACGAGILAALAGGMALGRALNP